MSTSTSTSARGTSISGTRRTTVRSAQPRLRQADRVRDRHAGRRQRLVVRVERGPGRRPCARRPHAGSPPPRRARPGSRRARRCSSTWHTGHHGHVRHSTIRDGWASASPPVAAVVAMASRSAKRASYSASASRPPGQVGASRSCHTTTSPSRPITPPTAGRRRRGRRPAAGGRRARAAAGHAAAGGRAGARPATARPAAGVDSGEVCAPVPGSLTLCRTTSTGTYPPAVATSRSIAPRRPPAMITRQLRGPDEPGARRPSPRA